MQALSWGEVRRQGPCIVALGNFDGVHLGHRHILDALVRESRASGLDPVLITFEPHPRYYFRPLEKPSLLTTPREKLELLGKWPIQVVPLAFDQSLAELEPEDFIESFLKDRLQGRRFLLGHDHRFGKRARGDVALMQKHVQDPAKDVVMLEPFKLDGEVVSSSAIRVHLEAARIDKANRLLGRPFSYGGKVVHGDGRGRGLGFPTANLDLLASHKATVAHGVYGGMVRIGDREYPAIANIGIAPTFAATASGQPLKIEVHVLDFSEDIYDQWVEFGLHFHVRPEKKFASVEDLRRQITSDIVETRKRLPLNLP